MSVHASRAFCFVLGLAVGAGACAWYYAAPAAAPAPAPSAATGTPAFPESGDISVLDQPAGTSTTVAWVAVPPPGVWVAVEEVEAGGALGNVLGAERVGGPRSAVVVPLLRATVPGMPYAIVLYRDDGDGAFSLASDSVYVDLDTGEPAEAIFHTE
ncbi:MAG TPA: hypothetical protein VHC68_02285 [Candidatus Paceibacterota bacterium]|nr:hypothetical protein [Candidatus Paceibacterota bacterium]